MAKKIAIINGPNLNLLGVREPSVYGDISFDKYFTALSAKYTDLDLSCFQSNSEGEIIDELQRCGFGAVDGIVLNAGAYSHYSLAIADAIRAISVPVIEVHISNVFAREDFRHRSVLSPVCKGVIAGFGLKSYELALVDLTDD